MSSFHCFKRCIWIQSKVLREILKLKQGESKTGKHKMSFEIFNFVWIQYHLFVNIRLPRTVVSSRNTVYRKQVILYSFIGVFMHTIARWFLELLSKRPKKGKLTELGYKRKYWYYWVEYFIRWNNAKKEINASNTSVSIRFANVKAGAPLTGGSSWYALLANKNFLSWH